MFYFKISFVYKTTPRDEKFKEERCNENRKESLLLFTTKIYKNNLGERAVEQKGIYTSLVRYQNIIGRLSMKIFLKTFMSMR